MPEFKQGFGDLIRSHGPRYNEYWKLGSQDIQTAVAMREELRARKFDFKVSAKKERIKYLYSRSERGLLSYEGIPMDVLRAFCAQRELNCDSKLKHNAIVRILEDADEAATFSGILNLPAELRNRIYTLHFESFPVLERPTTPPLTRTSKQVRQETLLLFYQSCTVYLQCFEYSFWPHSSLREPHIKPNFKDMIRHHALRTFPRISQNYLGHIWNLQVVGPVAAAQKDLWVHAEWHVSFAVQASEVHISIGEALCNPVEVPEGFEEARDRVALQLRRAFENINSREGIIKPHKGDWRVIEKLFKSNY